MKFPFAIVFFLIFVLSGVPVPAVPAVSQMTRVEGDLLPWILLAEDHRDEKPLLEHLTNGEKPGPGTLIRMAHASGRIPSFKIWDILSKIRPPNPDLVDALAVAARYPENNFPANRVFRTLKHLPPSDQVVETLLYLNTREAFEFAISLKKFRNTIARNLWRSEDFLDRKRLVTFYHRVPEAAVYSIYRSKTRGIIHARDIRDMDLDNRYYGCLVCDHPEQFLNDPAWQVRVAAIKASRSPGESNELLDDPVPLVRAVALEVYLQNGGDPLTIPPDRLNAMETGILVPQLKGRARLKKIFKRGGWFSELSAPYLDRNEKDKVLSSPLSHRAKILFIQNQMGEQKAISHALTLFENHHSPFALSYLLSRKQGVDKKTVIKRARQQGKFNSQLQDFGLSSPPPVIRPLPFYRAVLKEIQAYRGFKIITPLGTICCQFFLDEAPLTCFNFIKLAERGYFSNLIFHRVVPAFVSQDGDPTGTGSGGPGYAIRCEPNALKYDRPGMVGMALSGKDTGGSQYFITHLPTPHLNHQYTLFARVVSGIEILAGLCQYDKISEIRLF